MKQVQDDSVVSFAIEIQKTTQSLSELTRRNNKKK